MMWKITILTISVCAQSAQENEIFLALNSFRSDPKSFMGNDHFEGSPVQPLIYSEALSELAKTRCKK